MKHVQGNNHNLKFVTSNASMSFALYVAHGMKYKPVAVREYENSCLTGKHLLL